MMARAMSALDLTAPQVVAALGVCAPLVAGALDSSADPELESLVRANLEQFARCVRAEGVSDFPDPVRRFNGVGDPFPAARIPWTHPGLSEAVTVCGERILVHDG